ncbi:MAG TPA: M1 family aminopeptidase [Longimicrobiales bacterium]|nr:M1 family aminopeptidase [Longimicrobiales bacterium]
MTAAPARAALLSWALLCAAPLPGQVVEPDPIPAGMRAAPGTYDTGLDALHYDIELALSDDADWILGRVTLRMRATRAGVARAELDFTGLAVEEVRVDGAPREAGLRDGRLSIPLDRTLGAGDEVVMEVRYRGVPDDGLILRANVEGTPSAFVDNWPNRTRFWLPSVDHPSDKATARFTIHAPEAWEVVANGRLVGQPYPTAPGTPGPGTGPMRTWVYATDVPHPTYTLVVGGAEMVVTSLGTSACGRAPASARVDGCVESTTWFYPGSVASASPSFRRAVEMVDFFADVFGPFPYEKLAHVQSATRFGGMENASAIFYSEQGLASGRDMEGTVSHEIVHQWFGDSATPSDWAHLWLSEGFATYFGHVFFEYAEGVPDFRRRMAQTAQAYLVSPDTLLPVVNEAEQNLFRLLNRNSYQKGGWVLHMLRGLLGDEVFFRGIREYYLAHRHGNADTGDFRAVMERVSGKDLGWFFSQWLYQPGYPILAAVPSGDPDTGYLQVTLRQVQGEYAPRFRLPVTLDFQWGSHRVRETVTLEGASEVFTFPGVPSDARVTVDPDGWILKRLAAGS